MTNTSVPRHFLNLSDNGYETLNDMLNHAERLKAAKYTPPQLLTGLSLAMIFDKPSTRTRMSFEVACKQLGGHTLVMAANEMQIGASESIADTGRVLGRYVDAVMVRMSDHGALSELAHYTGIPVINGLSDMGHPCQIMADLMTVREKLGTLTGLKVAWFGDYNNVARSWAEAAGIFNFRLVCAVPQGLEGTNGKNVTFTNDPAEAAQDADILVTDKWASMGQEDKDLEAFAPFRVTSGLMQRAATHAVFMHCMPVKRGQEVSGDVLDSDQSIIYDEAENRLHAQKAILCWCMAEAGVEVRPAEAV